MKENEFDKDIEKVRELLHSLGDWKSKIEFQKLILPESIQKAIDSHLFPDAIKRDYPQ